ncbi:hypothetical protein CLOM_g15921 [Closterium sp. NIES-68]|nr:hypothetical protein CLOM_g15921 [Closterium sp. NIES-68]
MEATATEASIYTTHWVYRLKKAIYGLKQAPRAWYHKLEEALLAGGFKKSECDPSLFLLQEKDEILMLLRKYCEGLAEKYGLQDGGKPATPLPSGFTVEPCADEEVVGESDRKLFHSMMLLSCYTDASFNSVKADGTSIGGYVCLLGGGAVSWRSKKQNEQAADIFTKRLAEADHWKGMKLAGMSVH